MRSTAPCAAPSTRPPPNTRPSGPTPRWKPSEPRPEPRGARSFEPESRPNRPRARTTRDRPNRNETGGPHELLVPRALPRANPRLGPRALRVPVPVPAARRSLRTRDVHQLVEEQCFPPSPSGRVGVEIEWLAVSLADPTGPVRPEGVGAAAAQRPPRRPPPIRPRRQRGPDAPPPRGRRP